MLSFGEILGQPSVVELLRRLLASDRVPQALLFHGPEGVGKATTAATFSAALVCEQSGVGPCLACTDCALAAKGNHVDCLRVGRLTRSEIAKDSSRSRLATQEPDAAESDLGSQILIDQIRTLTRLTGLRPRRTGRRVFVIDPAERMGREAQNSLLKTLEEPPDRSLLILVSARPYLLLPTVRSRCFSVGFSALRTTELTAILEQRGLPREEAAARAALAGGGLGKALGLDLDTRRERRRAVFEMLDLLTDAPPAIDKLPAMAARLAGKDVATLLDGLELAQALLRDAAIAGCAVKNLSMVHADLAEGLTRMGRRLGPQRAAVLVDSTERLRADLRLNTNRVLTAEALLAAVAGGPLP